MVGRYECVGVEFVVVVESWDDGKGGYPGRGRGFIDGLDWSEIDGNSLFEIETLLSFDLEKKSLLPLVDTFASFL